MNRDSLLSLVQSDPERTKLLLYIAGGGAVVLSLWSLIGDSILSDFLYLPLTLALVVSYSIALILLTGNLVRDADKWQVESAMQARRLMNSPVRDPETAVADQAPSTFDHWYFVLRLDDEIKQARRRGGRLSVVLMKIEAPSGTSDAVAEQINFDVASMAASHSQTMAMPSAIAPLEYAFLMPDSDRGEARARVAPLLGTLGDYWCEFGVAVYPDDGTDPDALVSLARREIELTVERKAG